MRIIELISLICCYIIGVFLLGYNSDPINSLTISEGFGYLFMGVGILYTIILIKNNSSKAGKVKE